MDLQDLRIFLAVAEERSLPAAARRLRMSERGLYERVQRLERLFGEPLFDPASSSELTPAGAWLLSRATAVAGEWRSAAEQGHGGAGGWSRGSGAEAQGASPGAAARVRLAVPEVGSGNSQEYLSRVMPGRGVVVTAMASVEALERLGAGAGVDAVLVYDVPGSPVHRVVEGAHVATVVVEPLWVLMGARHRLAAQDEVSVEEVARWGLPWVVGPRGDPLRSWEEAFILGRAPGAQLREVTAQSQVEISQGRAVALASPSVPTTELLALRPLTPVVRVHDYVTWQPEQVSADVAAELLTALRGYNRWCATRNPRYWRLICDNPDAFPGIAPEPPPDPGPGVRPARPAQPAPPAGPARTGGAVAGLTSREREVLALVAAGCNDTEIGHELQLSPLTARTHVKNIRTKLGARDRVQLVVFAYQRRLLD